MQLDRSSWLSGVLTLLACASGSAEPGVVSEHVLVIGIDGCRSDALVAANTPHLDALIATGTVSYDAVAGGSSITGHPTQQATSSGPGWSSLCTGVWVDKHQVSDNGNFASGNFGQYPHFFKHIRDARPSAQLSSIVQWHPINQNLLTPYPGLASFTQDVADSGQAVEDAATAHLASAAPDVLFLHFDDVDHAGHATGFSPSNSAYLAAIEQTDAHIGNVLAAVQSRPNSANEDWLVVVSSDHGGLGTSHGGQSSEERTIWIITSGGSAAAGLVVAQGPGHTAVPPTVLEHLGIAVQAAWGFESTAFGFPLAVASQPQPSDGETLVQRDSELGWFPGAQVVSNRVYLGTQPVLNAAQFLIESAQPSVDPGSLASETTYYWRVDSVSAQGTQVGDVWSFTTAGELFDGMALMLDYEGDLVDHSGHHNHGLAVGAPGFAGGVSGQALDLDGSGSYVQHGTAAELDFAANTDFSIALWFRGAGWSGDPVLASNKDWVSGSNIGWILALDPNGTHWQWNYRGSLGTRVDFDAIGNIGDGAWHHLAVVHERAGAARFYQDGVSFGTRSIAGQGDIDSGLPTAVGQDGTLVYGIPLAAQLDGLQIWRRVLGAGEVAALHATGSQTFLGSNYCLASPNSTGLGAQVLATGSTTLASGQLQLAAVSLPAQTPGVFFTGPNQTGLSFGDGFRCVGGGITRFNPPLFASAAGVASLEVELGAQPFSNLFQPGTTWNFQFWYRDTPAQLTGFNLTDGLQLAWQ